MTVTELPRTWAWASPADPEARLTGPSVCDSREAGPGGMFVAITGEHADGHDYAVPAVAARAVCVLASRPVGVPAVVVGDVMAALGMLAREAGRQTRATVIGLTVTLAAAGGPAAHARKSKRQPRTTNP